MGDRKQKPLRSETPHPAGGEVLDLDAGEAVAFEAGRTYRIDVGALGPPESDRASEAPVERSPERKRASRRAARSPAADAGVVRIAAGQGKLIVELSRSASPEKPKSNKKTEKILLFDGLSRSQLGSLMAIGTHRHIRAGHTVFQAGDPVSSLFLVKKGKVEIFKDSSLEERILGEVGPDDTLGEIELLSSKRSRLISARAITDCTLFEIPRNPIDFFRDLNERTAALKILQNLICILGERLRSSRFAAEPGAGVSSAVFMDYPAESTTAEQILSRSLRGSLVSKVAAHGHLTSRTAKTLDYLCRQGDQADGFYFLHSGLVAVMREKEGREPKKIAEISAPNLVGELGFFMGKRRSASLRALESVTYTHFSGDDFYRLCDESPDEALDVLVAAGQLAAALYMTRVPTA